MANVFLKIQIVFLLLEYYSVIRLVLDPVSYCAEKEAHVLQNILITVFQYRGFLCNCTYSDYTF